MPHNPKTHHTESVLKKLRSVIPNRSLHIEESIRIAELQAKHLLALSDVHDGPIPEEIVTELPKLRIEHVDAPLAGACYWDHGEWVIEVNRRDSWKRRRFVVMHEYKHIIDHGHVDKLYPPVTCDHQLDHAEYVADYFAGCVLVPTVMLKRVWAHGLQQSHDLAEYFQVSERTIDTRLKQVGLVDPAPRCIHRHTMRTQLKHNLSNKLDQTGASA